MGHPYSFLTTFYSNLNKFLMILEFELLINLIYNRNLHTDKKFAKSAILVPLPYE